MLLHSTHRSATYLVIAVILLFISLPLAGAQDILGRAGYAIEFGATLASQWTAGGPSIQVSKGTCVDGNGNCQCCSVQESNCCGQV